MILKVVMKFSFNILQLLQVPGTRSTERRRLLQTNGGEADEVF